MKLEDLTEQNWQEAVDRVKRLIPDYKAMGFEGVFGLSFLQAHLIRYYEGERTLDLYESMIGAE